jgi:predicted amidohydrolase YtcJ
LASQAVGDRDLSSTDLELYKKLLEEDQLTVRVAVSKQIETTLGSLEEIKANIRSVADDPLFKEKNDLLRIIGVKTYMDGGMLTGSAYMREPWGTSKIYGITDPKYRGVLYITKRQSPAYCAYCCRIRPPGCIPHCRRWRRA